MADAMTSLVSDLTNRIAHLETKVDEIVQKLQKPSTLPYRSLINQHVQRTGKDVLFTVQYINNTYEVKIDNETYGPYTDVRKRTAVEMASKEYYNKYILDIGIKPRVVNNIDTNHNNNTSI